MSNSFHVQATQPGGLQAVVGTAVTPAPRPEVQAALEPEYLANRRQRFKTLVNRLTGGEMRRLLDVHPDAELIAFPLSYLYAFHWLRDAVHPRYRGEVLAKFRNPSRAFLMDLLEQAEDAAGFLRGYLEHWLQAAPGAVQQQRELMETLDRHGGDSERLLQTLLDAWQGLQLFRRTEKEAYRDLGREERERYAGMLGPQDRERLALVDALPDLPVEAPRFAKLGIIPAMGCPQNCRHCMFIWRPPMRNTPDPQQLMALVDRCTDSVLFTGGDLTRHLDAYYRAIGCMSRVRTFAILLNGDFASDPQATDATLKAMAEAIRGRPASWAQAQVLLQISFDEFHQEILADQEGWLRERIPVAKIANIVECAVRYPQIQLCLLHKQNALNFSMDLFGRGVVGRLVRELGRRGHQLQILGTAPSPRAKRNPLDPQQIGLVLKEASFVLAHHPDRPILLTSSTIDAYGRATLLEAGEAVNERDQLQQVLRQEVSPGEGFDTDLMFWFNGWATLFSAVHICLGDLYQDGAETIFARRRKDPLVRALAGFDRRLLALYAEVRNDLNARIRLATSPHQLFHSITEDAQVRLHMTRRLLVDV
jgi:hypothetical protein